MYKDQQLAERAFRILFRAALENKRRWWEFWKPRWYFADEPLRHDAANLVREARFYMAHSKDTRLVK
jgi:hypothetical protein